MSKAVMLSIRPKWCKKIASGEKTIEVRKTDRSWTRRSNATSTARRAVLRSERGESTAKSSGSLPVTASTSMTMIRFSRSDMRTTRAGMILALTVRVCTRKISRITLTASGCTAGTFPA